MSSEGSTLGATKAIRSLITEACAHVAPCTNSHAHDWCSTFPLPEERVSITPPLMPLFIFTHIHTNKEGFLLYFLCPYSFQPHVKAPMLKNKGEPPPSFTDLSQDEWSVQWEGGVLRVGRYGSDRWGTGDNDEQQGKGDIQQVWGSCSVLQGQTTAHSPHHSQIGWLMWFPGNTRTFKLFNCRLLLFHFLIYIYYYTLLHMSIIIKTKRD